MTISVTGFKAKWFVGSARVLAGVLAATMLVLELLAADGSFHQSLHQNGEAAAHSCVLCLFAQGQVDASEPLPVITPIIRPWCEPAPRVDSTVLVDFTYLSAPSRAPPALPSFLFAVA